MSIGTTPADPAEKVPVADELTQIEGVQLEEAPPAPEPKPEPTPEPKEGEEPEHDERFWSKFFDEREGTDLLTKYGSDLDAMDGIANSYKKLRERDEDAVLGRQVNENRAEWDAFQQAKQVPTAPATQPQPQPGQPPGPSTPEYDPAWQHQIMQDEEGRVVARPGAPPDVVGKYQRAMDFARQRMMDLAFNPQTALQPVFDQHQQAINTQTQQQLEQQSYNQQVFAEMQAFGKENAAWLYIDGDESKGPTAEFQQVDRVYQNLCKQGFQGKPLDGVKLAIQVLQSQQLPAKPTAPQTPQSQRTPNVAAPASNTLTEEDKMKALEKDGFYNTMMREAGYPIPAGE